MIPDRLCRSGRVNMTFTHSFTLTGEKCSVCGQTREEIQRDDREHAKSNQFWNL
jgi:hypothetical protein